MEPSLEQIFGSYVAWQAKEGTWFINFMNGSENMYLLEGEEKALLIDTGLLSPSTLLPIHFASQASSILAVSNQAVSLSA